MENKTTIVIPAQAGIQGNFERYCPVALDSRLRGNDRVWQTLYSMQLAWV